MINELKKKFLLGTAQFGNNYGITNNKELTLKEAEKILREAKSLKIDTLDTSEDYNNFKLLKKIKINQFQIITKLSLNEKLTKSSYNKILTKVLFNMQEFKVSKLLALLFRRPMTLLKDKYLWNKAKEMQNKNIINKLGFTVYQPEELVYLVKKFKPDLVQIPYSIFDRRFHNSGWIDKLYDLGIEIHVRSIFLQGLLLSNTLRLPKKILKYKKTFSLYEEWLKQNNLTKIEASLSILNNDERISRVLIGVQTAEELKEILQTDILSINYPHWMEFLDEDLINPSKW